MAFVPLRDLPDDVDHGSAVWLIVCRSMILRTSQGWPDGPIDSAEDPHVLGLLDGQPVFGLGVPDDTPAPEAHRFVDLYSLHAEVGHDLWLLAGRAVQIVEWARTHRFCGRCGAENGPAAGERALKCPVCSLLAFPRLSPAVIMAVHRGDEILLARGVQFQGPMYSVLAGFVEPGETLEAAVHREVSEEVGLEIGNLEYFASQPWPFPNSLMVGFFAEYRSGEITPDPIEILEAGWYHYDDMPITPPELSIAHRLIGEFVARRSP